MDETNKPKPSFSFPNSDRPLDSREETKGPVVPNPEHDTIKFKDVMENKEAQFIHNESGIPQIETYNSDVAQAIKKNSVSAMQIALAESKKQQDRQFAGGIDTAENSHSLIIKILIGILFIAIVILGYLWWAGYLTPKNETVPSQKNITQPAQQAVVPIKIEQRQIIPIEDKDSISIKNDINKARNGNVDAATIKEIALGTQANGVVNVANTEAWFTRLDTNASPQLVRALGSDYLMGVYGSSPRETFIIFNVKSYDNAFAGMLNWESYIKEDIGSIFERNLPQTQNATSTTNQRVFTDKILFNKDTRILNNNQGQTVLLYTFIDPRTLILVSSETGLRELISRLTTGKITR